MPGLILLCCLLGQEFEPAAELPAGEHAHMEGAADAHFDAPPVRDQSLLRFFLVALGPFYLFALFGSGFLLFVGAVLVVILGRPPVIAAYLALIPIPFLIGLYGVFDGMIAGFRIIASSTSAPRPNEVAECISTALVTGLIGTGIILPSLLVVALGLLCKTALASSAPTLPEIYSAPPQRG